MLFQLLPQELLELLLLLELPLELLGLRLLRVCRVGHIVEVRNPRGRVGCHLIVEGVGRDCVDGIGDPWISTGVRDLSGAGRIGHLVLVGGVGDLVGRRIGDLIGLIGVGRVGDLIGARSVGDLTGHCVGRVGDLSCTGEVGDVIGHGGGGIRDLIRGRGIRHSTAREIREHRGWWGRIGRFHQLLLSALHHLGLVVDERRGRAWGGGILRVRPVRRGGTGIWRAVLIACIGHPGWHRHAPSAAAIINKRASPFEASDDVALVAKRLLAQLRWARTRQAGW